MEMIRRSSKFDCLSPVFPVVFKKHPFGRVVQYEVIQRGITDEVRVALTPTSCYAEKHVFLIGACDKVPRSTLIACTNEEASIAST